LLFGIIFGGHFGQKLVCLGYAVWISNQYLMGNIPDINKNQNPSTTGKKFGFLMFGGDYGTRTHLNARSQWHLAATSSKTGGNHTLCRGQSGHRVL
jgi:hypothetical protein